MARHHKSHKSEMHTGHGSYHGYSVGEGHDIHEGMMRESHTEMSNCPKEVMMKAYPKIHSYLPEILDDSIGGVDRQMDGDDSKRARGMKPRKA